MRQNGSQKCEILVHYGGFKRENDCERFFGQDATVTELILKAWINCNYRDSCIRSNNQCTKFYV